MLDILELLVHWNVLLAHGILAGLDVMSGTSCITVQSVLYIKLVATYYMALYNLFRT